MVNRSEPSSAARSSLSSLMDGDLAPDAVADACSAWRQDADARASWHAYHLIGDVLRSDELAAPPARDEAFLQALRARLADEPVPLAPAPLVNAAPADAVADTLPQVANGRAPRRRGAGWLVAPAAVAAGFVAVAGVLVVTRTMAPDTGSAPTLAQATPATAVSADLVRDAGLDRYLAAHRSLASGAVAAGEPGQRVHIVFEPK